MFAADHYSEWLGIPENRRPPEAHELLGIAAWECDPEVIVAAADHQLQRVLAFASGSRAAASLRIGNEIVQARDALLDQAAANRGTSPALAAADEPAIPEAVYLTDDRTAARSEAVPAARLPDGAVYRDWRTDLVVSPGVPASQDSVETSPAEGSPARHVDLEAIPEEPDFELHPAVHPSHGSRWKTFLIFLVFYLLPIALFSLFAVYYWETRKLASIVCMSGALFSGIFGILHLLMNSQRRSV